jgi:hypothetical protein
MGSRYLSWHPSALRGVPGTVVRLQRNLTHLSKFSRFSQTEGAAAFVQRDRPELAILRQLVKGRSLGMTKAEVNASSRTSTCPCVLDPDLDFLKCSTGPFPCIVDLTDVIARNSGI